MDIILRVAVPVGVLRSMRRPDWSVVVLKVTYELEAESVLAPEQDLLSNAEDPAASSALPSDFIEDKSQCDVLLCGAALDWPGPTRLRVNGVDRTAPRAALLGPLREPAAGQIAHAEQRMAPITAAAPLQITVEGGGLRLHTSLRVPFPNVALVDEAISSVSAVPLQADTLLLDPVERKLSIVYRGSFSSPEDLDLSLALVVDALGLLARTSPREMKRWPRMEALESDSIDLDDADMEITRGGTVNVVRLARNKVKTLDDPSGPSRSRAGFNVQGAQAVFAGAPPTSGSAAPSGLIRRTVRMTTADVELARLPPPPAPPPPSAQPLSQHQTLPALPLWAPAPPPSETLHDKTLQPATLPYKGQPLLAQEDTHSETRFVLEPELAPKLEVTSNQPPGLDVGLLVPRPADYTPSPNSARTRPMSHHENAALKVLLDPVDAAPEGPPEKRSSAPPPSLEASPLHSMPTVEMSAPSRWLVDSPPETLIGPTLPSAKPEK